MNKRNLLLLVLLAVLCLSGFSREGVFQAQTQCPANTVSRLKPENYGLVVTPTSSQTQGSVRLRTAPAKDSPVISQLAPGSVFVVVYGPQCSGGLVWWNVISEIGAKGWIAQGDSTGFFVSPLNDASTDDSGAPATSAPIVAAPNTAFTSFQSTKVDVSGNVTAYQPAANFNNVLMANLLNHDQRQYLAQNEFVVTPATYLEFQDAYKEISSSSPALITPDSLLHSFHLVFDKVLRSSEEKYFLPLLRRMNTALISQADTIYKTSQGTAWEDAAKYTVAYIGVSAQLADPSATVPGYVKDIVTPEVTAINSASGVGPSAVFPRLTNGEDWSQYIPRGHYTSSDDLKSYFRAMMYYGRMTFRLSEPDETKSALLLITALRNITIDGVSGIDAWKDLYEPTVFFVGKSDDLSIPEYIGVMQQVYGQTSDLKTIQSQGVDAFIKAAKALPAPRIVGMLVNDTEDVTAVTQGLRFMGQRFVWDAYAFSQLMYKYVGTRDNPRGLPMALDIFAVMGSARALQILDQAGATAYANYSSQMAALRGEFGKLKEPDRTNTLYNAWLYIQDTLAQPVPSGYPAFMTRPAYADRLLSGALGSFAELKHDTILYTKQPEGLGGGGPPCDLTPATIPQPSYVEPVPLFWARLAALADMTDIGLNSRNLLSPQDDGVLKQIANLARRFEHDSILELKNQPLGAQEQADLSNYYVALQTISMATGDVGLRGMLMLNTDYEHFQPPHAALVADIASDANTNSVLEIATGNIFSMYAVVPIDGKLVLARGAVYSYYEFQHPMSDRLTDEKWQAILGQSAYSADGNTDQAPAGTPYPSQMPPLTSWTKTFMAPSSLELDLQRKIQAIQRQLEGTLYFHEDSTPSDDPIMKYILAQEAPLDKAGQNEERQIVSTNFSDIQLSADGKTATVIADETWQSKLHPRTEEGCSGDTVLAKRGLYTIHVKYVFTQGDDSSWSLTTISSSDKLPAWTYLKTIVPTLTPTPDAG